MVSAEIGTRFMEKTPRFVNRGVSGRRLEHIVRDWESDVTVLHPDLITLLIGVNDALHTTDVSDWVTDYRALLRRVRAEMPTAPLVLLEPFYFPMLPSKADPYETVPHPRCEEDFPWPARNNTLELTERNVARLSVMQQTVKETAAEVGAIFIPLQSLFTETAKRAPLSYLVWDGIHPTVVGHRLIADAWLTATRHSFEK